MTEYGLYLESGPQHRKTLVHVLGLLGCVANGPTSEAAVATTPASIRLYLAFLRRHGEDHADGAFTTPVIEHLTQGTFMGNGSGDIIFGPDLEPLSQEDIERYVRRFQAMRRELAAWAAGQTDAQLDEAPATGGRSSRHVLLHILAGPGAYLSPALGGSTGYSRLQTAVERGQISIVDGLLQVEGKVSERLLATTPAERSAVIQRPKGDVRTLRKAIRRILEHDWEHFMELWRRPSGPEL